MRNPGDCASTPVAAGWKGLRRYPLLLLSFGYRPNMKVAVTNLPSAVQPPPGVLMDACLFVSKTPPAQGDDRIKSFS